MKHRKLTPAERVIYNYGHFGSERGLAPRSVQFTERQREIYNAKRPRRVEEDTWRYSIRWFLPPGASVGPMLESWFGPTQDEGKRTDHYLRTGRSDLNLKARLEEGKPAKVETKYLVGSLGATDLATNISGELQRWTKLSLSLNDPKLKQHGAWLEVTKRRQLRKYKITMTPAPEVNEVSLSAYPAIGCGVELTRLDYALDGATHVEWTFGLEAVGPTSQLLDVMQATLRAISPGLPNLPAEWTASYATWLLSKITCAREC